MNSSTFLYAFGIVCVLSLGMAAIESGQSETVASPYAGVADEAAQSDSAGLFSDPDEIVPVFEIGCPCDCADCICTPVAAEAPAGENCPGGVCPAPQSAVSSGSCVDGSCRVSSSSKRRVSSGGRYFSRRPVRSFLGRLFRR